MSKRTAAFVVLLCWLPFLIAADFHGVIWPSSTTDNALFRADGTDGAVQTAQMVEDDSGNVTVANNLIAGGSLSINGTDLNLLSPSYAEAFIAVGDTTESAAITAGSPVVAAGTLTMGVSTSDWTLTTDGNGGTLTYTGSANRVVVVATSQSLSSTKTNANVLVFVALNQVVDVSSRVQRLLSSGAGDTGALSTHTLISVTTGDDIQVFVDLSASSSNTVTADDLTITIHAIGP